MFVSCSLYPHLPTLFSPLSLSLFVSISRPSFTFSILFSQLATMCRHAHVIEIRKEGVWEEKRGRVSASWRRKYVRFHDLLISGFTITMDPPPWVIFYTRRFFTLSLSFARPLDLMSHLSTWFWIRPLEPVDIPCLSLH